MLRALIATLAIATALAAACGSPSGDDAPFTYDPIPYTVVIERGTPIAIAVDENGDRYRADALSVLMKPEDMEAFSEWGKRYGFEVTEAVRYDRLGLVLAEVHVPPGSAPAALKLVRTQQVISADLVYYWEVQ